MLSQVLVLLLFIELVQNNIKLGICLITRWLCSIIILLKNIVLLLYQDSIPLIPENYTFSAIEIPFEHGKLSEDRVYSFLDSLLISRLFCWSLHAVRSSSLPFRSLRMNMMQTPTNMKEPGRSKIIATIDRKGLLDDQLIN